MHILYWKNAWPKRPGTVRNFSGRPVRQKRCLRPKKNFKNWRHFAKKLDGIDGLEKWDSAYYSEKLKQDRFNFDDEQLKPYFKLENVIDGAFEVAQKLFGLPLYTNTRYRRLPQGGHDL